MKHRLLSLFLVLCLVFGGAGVATYSQCATADASSRAKTVLKLMNKKRASKGRCKLKMTSKLNKVAKIRAKEIAKYFSHTRPNGESCFTVLEEQGVTYMMCGENIAAGYSSGKKVYNGWYHSKGHRENMMNKEFRKVGIYCYKKPSSLYRYYWVQVFTS